MAAEKENDRRTRVRDLEKMWTAGYKTTGRRWKRQHSTELNVEEWPVTLCFTGSDRTPSKSIDQMGDQLNMFIP